MFLQGVFAHVFYHWWKRANLSLLMDEHSSCRVCARNPASVRADRAFIAQRNGAVQLGLPAI